MDESEEVIGIYLDGNANVVYGYDRNLQPLEIRGMEILKGSKWYKMEWRNSEMLEMLPSHIVEEKYPQLVKDYNEQEKRNQQKANK